MNEDKINKVKISTDPYKGVRDFYPEDMAIENHIFNIWKKTTESFGYEEYSASILESADLYKAKSGEEIVNEQTYTFTDRGGREVTLRPEMTPTIARMISAKKRELSFPLRWYSIPNVFRYEQPQRGRLREHFQLNVDVFGIESTDAEIEVISLGYEIMKSYGLKDTDFEILINNRKVMNYVTKDMLGLDEDKSQKLCKLIDKKNKLKPEAFEMGVQELLTDRTPAFMTLLNSKNFEEFTKNLKQTAEEHEGLKEIKEVIAGLDRLGIRNVRFDQTLMRGFDYYTGIVFEVFDTNPENRRSIFGGGRYDELLSIFGGEKVPAFGFGAGDVTAKDLLEIRDLLPKTKTKTELYICPMQKADIPFANEIAQKARTDGVNTAVDYSKKKVGDKIKFADKKGIPFVTVIGEEEKNSGTFKIKNLLSGKEEVTNVDSLSELIKKL
ncbi:MAG: histidine--tRNA ligase [Candidatus Taylorbacteria bacterium]|nr:histidine--tRNA ligase [Candidatus Taylorbacteria bacterium]